MSHDRSTSDYVVKPLDPGTWDAFARLAERHNGVWGGCWCTSFHASPAERRQSGEGGRALKERLVNEGRAHAALVFDGDEAVAWCEYGTPEELPNIYHRKEYEAGLDKPPDYRLNLLLRGQELPAAGDGRRRTSWCPRPDRAGRRCGREGIPAGHYVRPKGKNHCVMRKRSSDATSTASSMLGRAR
jgi:hypothetical protein